MQTGNIYWIKSINCFGIYNGGYEMDVDGSLGLYDIENDVLDVENLIKELAELKEKYRWRDVNEELPELTEEVLVVLKTGYQTIGWRDSDGDETWWDVHGPDYFEVTHWAPMPEFK